MVENGKDKYVPNYAVHPGIILKDDLKMAKLSQSKLSELIGVQKTIVNEIINGKRNINPKFALLLETVFPYEAEYWLRLQSFYDLTVERLSASKKSVDINFVNEQNMNVCEAIIHLEYNRYYGDTYSVTKFAIAG